MRYAAGFLVALFCSHTLASQPTPRTLTFADRVNAQEAIERVYYSHQVGSTKPFEQAVPRAVLEAKVQKYLDETAALKVYWKTAVTDEMLELELERMAHGTRMPERLLELYQALGNDSFLIKECLARATLVDRLARNFYAFDAPVHAPEKGRAEELHRQLSSGELNPATDHPGRSVVEFAIGRKTTDGPGGEPLTSDAFQKRRARLPEGIGRVSTLFETRDTFVLSVVLHETKMEVRAATYVIAKTPWEEWWATARNVVQAEPVTAAASDRGPLPTPTSMLSPSTRADRAGTNALSCANYGTWNNGALDDAPDPRDSASSVWTGSVMVIWAGRIRNPGNTLNTGWRYEPATDTWTPTSTVNAPSARYNSPAVWTGNLMIVWGGIDGSAYLGTGGRYDPAADTWTPISPLGAPSARAYHTAVWTGTLMTVWGGYDGVNVFDTGGRYDPATDTWTPTSTVLAPSATRYHTAVWTGSRMIVWPGGGGAVTGGRYDPASDTWTPISSVNAPLEKLRHTAVWTGSRMIVWGGYAGGDPVNTGGRYDPATDTWTPTATTGAPHRRADHTAVWTGSQMLVWGGYDGVSPTATGGRYDPATDTWTSISTVNAPSARLYHSGVWTGSLMIVWGGRDSLSNTGGRYDPVTDSWTPTSTGNAPSARQSHTAIWSGSLMIVWGGYGGGITGGRYDPATDAWTPTSTLNAPSARTDHTAVWTGTLMIVWGGKDSFPSGDVNTGGRYDPATDTWAPTATVNAPSEREIHAAIWTGSRMIVWGGFHASDGVSPNTGGRYDPATDTWTPTSTVNAPSAGRPAIWTGTLMIVWGGGGAGNMGGRYDPATDTWTPTSIVNAPSGLNFHTAVWTGGLMIVWGGSGDDLSSPGVSSGGRYAPATDTWTPTSTVNAPSARHHHTAVWTGSLMIVWGGDSISLASLSSGGRYAPQETTLTWYRDLDGDGYGDAANSVTISGCDGPAGYVLDGSDCDDTHGAVHPGASESCDGLDNNCNGQIDEDASGLDSDGDAVRNACDDCVFDANPSQSDFDHDGQGDVCDLDDGLIYVYSTAPNRVEWQPEGGFATWNVYEGDLAVLRATGTYTQAPGSNALAKRECGVTNPWVDDVAPPPAGKLKFALVTGRAGGVESGLGTNSAGVPRANSNPCP